MRNGRKTVAPAPVLRNVEVQDMPHALARPRRTALHTIAAPTVSVAMEPIHLPQARSFDEGVAAGYHEGISAGRAAQQAENEAWLREMAEEARSKAFAEGHAEGLSQGNAQAAEAAQQLQAQLADEGRAAVEAHRQRIEQIARGLSDQSVRLAADAEDDLVAMSFEVVCRVLGARAAAPAAIRGMVEQLLAQRAQAGLTVHLHPDDLEYLQFEAGDQSPATPWQWVGDEKVQLGGVLLRSAHGNLDARLEVQLDALRQSLLNVRRERRAVVTEGQDA